MTTRTAAEPISDERLAELIADAPKLSRREWPWYGDTLDCLRELQSLRALAPPQEVNEWKQRLIDKLVVSFIYMDEHETNPEKAINDLLDWEVKIALDPLVSEEARALIEQGRSKSAPAQEPVDCGPWRADNGGNAIYSDDFTHDVWLLVSGDFATPEERKRYADWLAAQLNAAPPPDTTLKEQADKPWFDPNSHGRGGI